MRTPGNLFHLAALNGGGGGSAEKLALFQYLWNWQSLPWNMVRLKYNYCADIEYANIMKKFLHNKTNNFKIKLYTYVL